MVQRFGPRILRATVGAALLASFTTISTPITPSTAVVAADVEAHVAIDEFGQLVVVTLDDPRLITTAAMFLARQSSPEESAAIAAEGAPPCKPDSSGSDVETPSSVAEVRDLDDRADSLTNGSVADEASSRRRRMDEVREQTNEADRALSAAIRNQASARNSLAAAWERGDTDAIDAASSALAAANDDYVRTSIAFNELFAQELSYGFTTDDVLALGTDRVVGIVEAMYADDPSEIDDGFLDRLATALTNRAAAARAAADRLDAEADEAEQAGDDEGAAATRAAAAKKREEAERADAEAKKAAERAAAEQAENGSSADLTDPDIVLVSAADLESLLATFPWLAGTPWDPTRPLQLLIELDPLAGVDPTVSHPDPNTEPSRRPGALPTGVYDGLILILDPVEGAGGSPCFEIAAVLSVDETEPSPTVVNPNPYDEEVGGPVPIGPGSPLPLPTK